MTDSDGWYLVNWSPIPCPMYYNNYSHTGYADAWLQMRRFNPKAENSPYPYILSRIYIQGCYADPPWCIPFAGCRPLSYGNPTIAGGKMDFFVDTMTLSGQAYMTSGQGVIPIADQTTYKLSGFAAQSMANTVYDYDGDGAADTVVIGSMQPDPNNPGEMIFQAGEQGVDDADKRQGI